MYQQYFGLSESPFSIAPDPRYLFLSDKHREALAHLIYGVGDQGGFVVLTGEVGTGKTTICRCLLQQVPDNADIAYIINPRQSINQLLQSVCNDLGISYHKGITSKDLIDQLNHYLLEAHARGRNTILLIDEAQNLSVDVLEQLRLLTNLETNEKKLLQLVLLGQPELNELLAKTELRQLAQRVTARYHLTPLSKAELTEYIQHRLSVAGCRAELFPRAAINKIYRLTQGVPRLINLICDRSLLGVYATGSSQASPTIIANAAKEVFPPATPSRWRTPWLAALLAVLLLLSTLWWTQQPTAPSTAAISTAPTALPANPASMATAANQAQPSNSVTPEVLRSSLSQLFQLWGLAEMAADRDCAGAPPAVDLFCLTSVTTFDELLHYNVPAVLQLQSPSGTIVSGLLQSVHEQQAHFLASSGNFNLSLQQLKQHRILHSHLLSRLPPDLQLPIAPGDSNHRMSWLRQQLLLDGSNTDKALEQGIANVDSLQEQSQKSSKTALLFAHYLVFTDSSDQDVYAPTLVSTVKQLQQQLGLPTTAVIDLPLLTALSGQRHQTDPVLVSPAGRKG